MGDLITRYLGALSAIQIERGKVVHYIYQLEDGNLIKKSFFQDWSLPDFIGPARPGASVAHYLDDSKEIVVSLNESNVLQDYQFDIDEEEWTLGGLSDLNYVATPGTKLSITKHEETLHLYYQKESGTIQELVLPVSSNEATWKASEELSVANPLKDTSISAVNLAGTIHVFYVNLDRCIHRCSYEGNSWQDNNTGGLEDESLPIRIAASIQKDRLEVFYKTEMGDIVALEEGVGRRKIGTVGADGAFMSAIGGDREERFAAGVVDSRICVIT
ncbi:uncharacterized protein LAJ45_06638 [Morchella importuna]|uniref:uncharacterized protein n=1 Tax=Morchella importuna TaxID=1174673 RepID=UPI001E8DB027|nr:uncharacterized protein LAJ45_06638 [Morchella importuna]KAH8149099.1 hypothetical protein LAJ45_06638 [Morchella importuna]